MTSNSFIPRTAGWVSTLALLVLTLRPLTCLAAPALSVDAVRAILNGRPVFELNVDQITNILGRPSAVDNRLVDIVGPTVFYHGLGLKFYFHPAKTDPERRCWGVVLYMSKSWDADRSEFFLPYSGELSPPAKATWKARDTLRVLAKLNPVEATPEAQQAGSGIVGGKTAPFHVVSIKGPSHTTRFLHEPSTLFLEQVALASDK